MSYKYRVKYDDVKKQIDDAVIGSTVEVLVSNGTRRNGSSPYYRRTGVLVDKTDTVIIVLIANRKYKMNLDHDFDWVGDYPNQKRVQNDYAHGLYYVKMVA